MSRPPAAARPVALFALLLASAVAACNDPYALPPATTAPAIFDLTLWSITGTSLASPSAYDLLNQTVVRTDRTSVFDFAFDIPDSLGDTVAVLLPRGALGLYRDGGLQLTTTPFDQITTAPNSGYDQGDPLPVKLGDVVLAASRSQTCNFGFVRPYYAKMKVTGIDFTERSITLHMLVDANCGYSSLDSSDVPPTK